ncbi:MAG: hypothetical protein FVQ83_14860 [Chloroflexi bacterium]|nr:hypothetical protein [Chloroflexota bacterium]
MVFSETSTCGGYNYTKPTYGTAPWSFSIAETSTLGLLVHAAWLSVRAGPGVWFARLGFAAFGQRVLVYEHKDGWGKTPFIGTYGWINLSWVRAE